MDANFSQLSIEIDPQRKQFCLSAPVFHGSAALPKAIAQFFASLGRNSHATFSFDKHQIAMRQVLPFAWGPQPTLRQQVYQFLQRARRCRHLLNGASNIEKLRDVNSLLDP